MLSAILLLFVCGGLLLIFSHSPFFGVFGVLLHAISHACLLCLLGVPFFGLLVAIIYVGGMLVVFLFSTILSAERYPEFDFFLFLAFLIGVFALALPLLGSGAASSSSESFSSLTLTEGFFCQYKCFGLTTCVVGVVLLVALVAVLEFGFEHGRSALRKL